MRSSDRGSGPRSEPTAVCGLRVPRSGTHGSCSSGGKARGPQWSDARPIQQPVPSSPHRGEGEGCSPLRRPPLSLWLSARLQAEVFLQGPPVPLRRGCGSRSGSPSGPRCCHRGRLPGGAAREAGCMSLVETVTPPVPSRCSGGCDGGFGHRGFSLEVAAGCGSDPPARV